MMNRDKAEAAWVRVYGKSPCGWTISQKGIAICNLKLCVLLSYKPLPLTHMHLMGAVVFSTEEGAKF